MPGYEGEANCSMRSAKERQVSQIEENLFTFMLRHDQNFFYSLMHTYPEAFTLNFHDAGHNLYYYNFADVVCLIPIPGT